MDRGRGNPTAISRVIRPGRADMMQMRSAKQDRLVDIVGDEQHCGAKRLPDVEQQLLHGKPRLCIERAEWLVHQQRAWAHHQHAGDADALAHATG